MNLARHEPLAVAVIEAIQKGDVSALQNLLKSNPGLGTARLVDSGKGKGSRTLLQVATDWPGHFPNVAATIPILVANGADVEAQQNGPQAKPTETPLHWAASSDDLDALDALLDAGANIEAPGAVIAGGTPLDDAVAFGQWRAARRLVERGARVALWHAAALGLMTHLENHFAGKPLPSRYPWGASADSAPDEITVAFWCACHGGQRETAEFILKRGADLNWASVWDGLTPLDAARRAKAAELGEWLESQGAKSADDMK